MIFTWNPVSEEILGWLLEIQENMENDAEESHNKMSGKKKKPKENIEVQSRDIRSMLKPVPRKDTDESKNTNQPAGTRRPGDVPWRPPKGANVRDLQGTFRGLLGDQQKNW